MFNANDNQKFVATRNVSIKPESIVPYNTTTNNPKFHISQSLGFIDPSSLFLKYNLKFSGRGCYMPDTSAGALSLWRDMRLQTGDGRTTIEDLQDMNVKTAHDHNLNQNNSINNRRALYEGKSVRNASKKDQLYLSPPASNPSAEADAYEQIQIQHGLPQSGILGHHGRVFPVMSTDGVRVSLTLDNLARSVVSWTANCNRVEENSGSGLGLISNPNSDSATWDSFTKGHWNNYKDQQADWLGLYGIDGTGGGLDKDTADNGEVKETGTAINEQEIVLTCSADATCPKNPLHSGTVANLRDAKEGDADFRPFSVGDALYVGTVASPTSLSGPSAEMLGIVSGFSTRTDGGHTRAVIKYYAYGPGRTVTNGGAKLARDYPLGSAVFVDSRDRFTKQTYVATNGLRADAVPVNLQNQEAVTYEITDLELVVNQVSPPESYVSALQNQISKGELNFDYKTTTMYRHNQETKSGLTNQIIPAVQSRAYSVVSIPLDAEVQNSDKDPRSSFKGVPDGIQNYQYVVGSSLQPNRPVDCKRYNSPVIASKYEPLHMMELEKATVASHNAVRSWWDLPNDFSVGRAFALNSQVHNINGQDLALRAEYKEGTVSKLFQHFICHLNTLKISADGAVVVR